MIHQSFKSAKMTQLAVLGLLIVNKMGIGLVQEGSCHVWGITHLNCFILPVFCLNF